MKTIVGIGARGVSGVALATLVSACSAAKAPPTAASPQSTPAYGQPVTGPSAPLQPQPGGGAMSAQQRSIAVTTAANEVESSQRELDVAAGDCRNACRALGSMDRATGRLCGLTQDEPETRRCDDARHRVYSARDRVKATCGRCEGGPSVERSAPIPSLR